MLRLIKAEMYKLFKSNTYKVLCIVAILLVTLSVGMTILMKEEFIMESSGMSMEEINGMLGVDQDTIIVPGQLGFNTSNAENSFDIKGFDIFNVSFGIGVIEVIIAVLVGTMAGREYSEGTIKNMLAYGEKRYRFYLSKFIASLIGIITIMIILSVGSTVALTILKGWGRPFQITQLLDMIKTFIAATVVYAGVLAVSMLLSTVVKSNGATISIAVVLFDFLPVTASFLYNKNKIFDRIYESTLYYNSQLAVSIKASNSDILVAMGFGLMWTVITLILGVYIFNRQEIK